MNFAFLATSFWNTPSSEMTQNINCVGSVMLRTLRFLAQSFCVALVLVKHKSKCWVISRKELEAAKMLSELMLQTSIALRNLMCKIFCWTDSQVVLKWIVN